MHRSTIAALLSILAATTTPALETDPARRSLVVQAVERTKGAVVNISTEEVVVQQGSPFPFAQDPLFQEFFRDFMDPRPRKFTRTSLGSGVIVSADGTILTNEHVVARATRITVTLADGREFQAKALGADGDSDLAVIKVTKGERFPAVTLGTSRDLMIGESVIAIGNPFGLSHTVTTGVVSALGRTLNAGERTYNDFIQTDASINPGNSGGPLLNIAGDLIGITTAIYGKAQGIGFAIPIDRARRVMRELVAHGEVRRPWIGLVVQPLTDDLAEHFAVDRGVVVADVEPGSPAESAGLVRGDVITDVEGQPVTSDAGFDAITGAAGIGDSLRLRRLRAGETVDVTLTAVAFPDADADDLAWRRLGITVASAKGGVVVAKVRAGSPADRIGVERGDRVLAVAGAEITKVSDFRRHIVEVRGARAVALSIGRGRYQSDVMVPLAR